MIIRLTGVLDSGENHTGLAPENPRITVSLPRGVTATVEVRVVTPGGQPVDLSGYAAVMTVKKSSTLDSPDPGFVKSGTVSTGEKNLVTFSVAPGDTKPLTPGRFVYDVWVTSGAGARDPVVPISPLNLEPAATPPP